MYYLIHYAGEIAIKGKNRFLFEKQLITQIEKLTAPQQIQKFYGGFFLVYPESLNPEEILKKLKTIFGISLIYPLKESTNLAGDALALVKIVKNWETFKVETQRTDKKYPLNSLQLNQTIGEVIYEACHKAVDLKSPDLTVYIQVIDNKCYLGLEKIKGLGGLPSGASGKLVSLISSGIDSPVASWRMMKRGAKIIFAHFHSYPYTNTQSVENVKRIIQVLNAYQGEARLYSVAIGKIQKKLVALAPSEYRVLIYRRLMLKLAENIARQEKAQGLVTGESLGQVASQTLANLNTTNRAVTLPIFRPLISDDKQEIIDQAKTLGTYQISIEPYQDCCSFLIPKVVVTKSRPQDLEKIEAEIGVEALLKEAEYVIIDL